MNNNRGLLILTLFSLLLSFKAEAQTYRAWVNAGDKAMNTMRYAEAIEYYRNALTFETWDPQLSYKMAEACRLYNDYPKAAEWYLKTLSLDKENNFPLTLFRIGEMKKYLGQYDESKTFYERYIAANPQDTTYYGIKSKKEVSFYPEIKRIAGNPDSLITVDNMGKPVNTTYSDFGAVYQGDSVLYYSSLRYLFGNSRSKKGDPYYVSRILKVPTGKKNALQPAPLNMIINDPPVHNCNPAFSPDYKFMIFSRCSSGVDFSMDCELFLSHLQEGKWSKPEKITGEVNIPGYTSTQPTLEARGAEGYTLYFISDRPGGYGKLDVWKSEINAALEFKKPVNAGENINTFDDEMTPFFDTPGGKLYFSSYGHAGLGGMDIFVAEKQNENFSSPVNLRPPVNTSVNDIYYTINEDTLSGTLTSNREGSLFIISRTCCYDVYAFRKKIPVLSLKDSVSAISGITPDLNVNVPEDLSNPASYEEFLPLVLYFDNDEPGRKSMAVTTSMDYEKLYTNYVARLPEYILKFTEGLSGESKSNAENAVRDFFDQTVVYSYNRLEAFAAKVEKALNEGNVITLEVRGRTSPLAKTEYNVNLSKRRIASLVNYLMEFNNGSLSKHIANQNLKIVEVAAGESLVKAGISDELKDTRNSVYNPDAAVERRIELINILISKPEDKK
jgi:tetratricopeptide (TPR) repeat protein